jgi:RNA polymerase sigma factor (sigma-70 family)
MNFVSDQHLLTEYAQRRSDAAFAELVRRHLPLVYSTARRIVLDSHLAEDIAQRVFATFAQNAGKLARRTVIGGWLHRTTHNFAVMTIRSEERRRAREQVAFAAMTHDDDTTGIWSSIAQYLDDAIARLRESDRDAIALHFFERKTAAEISVLWAISPDAAQKRVTRAVDRLRGHLARYQRGLTAPVLAVTLSAHAIAAAPAHLAGVITTHALAQNAAIALPAAKFWLSSFHWLAPLRGKPWIVGTAAAAVLSLGAGGFFAGRLASEKHARATAWELAVLASLPATAAMASTLVQIPTDQNLPAPEALDVEEVLAEAARLLRLQDSDPYAWAQAFTTVERLRPGQGRAALDELQRYREESNIYRALAPFVMAVWAQTEPRAALDHALAHYEEHTLAKSLEFISHAWAQQDAPAAWAWFRATTDEKQIPISHGSWMWLPSFIFSEWVIRDPSGAFSEFQRMPHAEQRNAIHGIAAAALDTAHRPAILAGIAALPKESDRLLLAAKTASNWARLSPSSAAQWVSGLTFRNSSARLQVMSEVAEEWWSSDPHATVQWLITNSPPEMLDEVHAGIREMANHSTR